MNFGLQSPPPPSEIRTGYGTHGDYVFGWKDNSLQDIMDEPCYVNCRSMKTQSIAQMNACTKPPQVDEEVDGCKWAFSLSGFPFLLLFFCKHRP